MRKGIIAISILLLAIIPALCSSYDLIVVRGDLPVDKTLAVAYAYYRKIPIVEVSSDTLSEDLARSLQNYLAHGMRRALIIGGSRAVSEEIERELRLIGFDVDRIWDWDRYGTAARIAMELWGRSDTVILVDGTRSDLFLVASRVSMEERAPILFLKDSEIPERTETAIKALGARRAIVLDSSSDVRRKLQDLGIEVVEVRSAKYLPAVPSQRGGTRLEILVLGSLLLVLSILILASYIPSLRERRAEEEVAVLTEDEARILSLLRSGGSLKQDELADRLGFSRPKVSKLLKKLEERGLIARRRSGRTYVVSLTEEGRRVA